ncbi:phosphatase PAP2 family protein [Psychrobacter phenylpyruvicus]|uniref:undecaprenyl-diphosphate phosphatase n=1 Tax=Psychrobacter phenylpyruvicus TaxID=29432 RepID=A0A379LIW9_9GAMM|nr:phosphatase PAP2 family protein [Psychrobacter phenylpyruvicus]SUD90559.1 PAP2 superfamily [Psychrobacter phenylpyruvicus]
MMNIIETNQQLFGLGGLLFVVMTALWVVQYVIIGYGKKTLIQLQQYWVSIKQRFELDKRRLQFKTKYPKFYRFLSQRLHLEHFYGLLLTVLSLVMGYILALFVGLVEDVVTSDSIVAMDHFVSQQMSVLSDSAVVNFFIVITSLASTPLTALVILLTGIVCLVIRQYYLFIGLLISVIGSTAFTYLSKLVFHRERPIDILLHEATYSFPSGHATVAVALYGYVAYMLFRFSHDFGRQVRILVNTVFLCILIGLSRIVLNEHYLSDVLGGYLVGALWLTVAISVTEWLNMKGMIHWQLDWSISQVRLVWFSAACVLIGALIFAALYQFPLLV